MRALGLVLVRLYRIFLSPQIPSSCRFQPTCSQYGYEAIEKYGLSRGVWLALRRIGRCHPFSQGGYDPLP